MRYAKFFPELAARGFRETSDPTANYNCIAWAAGINNKIWDPGEGGHWPEDAIRDYSINAVISVYKNLGYEECDGPDFEAGFQKIAIYGMYADFFDHAALQLPTGKWTSKLGIEGEDIEHDTLEGIVGGTGCCDYGVPRKFMKRRFIQDAATPS